MDHPPVLMYSKRSCPFCVRAKALLQSKGVEFEEIDLIIEPERRDEMIRRAGARTVPQIFINGFPDREMRVCVLSLHMPGQPRNPARPTIAG